MSGIFCNFAQILKYMVKNYHYNKDGRLVEDSDYPYLSNFLTQYTMGVFPSLGEGKTRDLFETHDISIDRYRPKSTRQETPATAAVARIVAQSARRAAQKAARDKSHEDDRKSLANGKSQKTKAEAPQLKSDGKTVLLEVLVRGVKDFAEEKNIEEAHEFFEHLCYVMNGYEGWAYYKAELKKFFRAQKRKQGGQGRGVTMTGDGATYNEINNPADHESD